MTMTDTRSTTRRLKQALQMQVERLVEYPRVAVGRDEDRARVLWLAARLAEIPAGSRLLDAGAGEQFAKRFCGHLHYVAQDFAQYDGRGDQKGMQTGVWDQSALDIISDICAIPVPDGSFDAVLCGEVLEHLPDPNRALRELTRVLRVGGRLLLTAPFASLTHFSPYHYATGFNRYFYEKQLGDLGYSIERLDHYGDFFQYVAQELRRLGEMAETHAGTKLSYWQRWLVQRVLVTLQRLHEKDSGSHELLTFGYLVSAVKHG
jgi:ubiquinone/menaquinone biosynthesis C-methylase UbiE